jgi:hypothetical protein
MITTLAKKDLELESLEINSLPLPIPALSTIQVEK